MNEYLVIDSGAYLYTNRCMVMFQTRIYLGMTTLKELIVKRPCMKLEFLDVLLDFTSHEKNDVRNMSCRVVSCRVVSCRVVSCRVVSCRVVSCRVVSCLVLSCLVLSCLVLSCLVLSDFEDLCD